MGCDIHLILERRVPDCVTLEAKRHIGMVGDGSSLLPAELIQHCGEQLSHTYEWLPVKYHEWIALSDEDFSERVHLCYEVRAAKLVSILSDREVSPNVNGQSLWPFICSLRWRSQVTHSFTGRPSLYGREMDVHRIDDVATTEGRRAVGLPDQPCKGLSRRDAPFSSDGSKDLFEWNGAYSTLRRQRNYERYSLFSSAIGSVRVPDEHIQCLSCMHEGDPDDTHPSYQYDCGGEHSECFCMLDVLLATNWDVICDVQGRSRRQVMGQRVIDELNTLGDKILGANLNLSDFRLLVSFDS